MYEIEMEEMSPEFLECWKAAGEHLDKQVQGGFPSWLRAHPYPPFLEHLSFRLGNQLFFVRVEDVNGRTVGPGNLSGLLRVADANNGHACLMPMGKKHIENQWVPDKNGWGLIDAGTKRAIDPCALVTDEKIEMTPWELQDLSVQVVRDHLMNQGYHLMSWQGDPEIDPAIWFVGDSKEPEWVVVRATRYPESSPPKPTNWQSIAIRCQRLSNIGHFASVAMASSEQPFESEDEPVVPLWRGHAMHVSFAGLE